MNKSISDAMIHAQKRIESCSGCDLCKQRSKVHHDHMHSPTDLHTFHCPPLPPIPEPPIPSYLQTSKRDWDLHVIHHDDLRGPVLKKGSNKKQKPLRSFGSRNVLFNTGVQSSREVLTGDPRSETIKETPHAYCHHRQVQLQPQPSSPSSPSAPPPFAVQSIPIDHHKKKNNINFYQKNVVIINHIQQNVYIKKSGRHCRGLSEHQRNELEGGSAMIAAKL